MFHSQISESDLLCFVDIMLLHLASASHFLYQNFWTIWVKLQDWTFLIFCLAIVGVGHFECCPKMILKALAYHYKTQYTSFAQCHESNQNVSGSATVLPKKYYAVFKKPKKKKLVLFCCFSYWFSIFCAAWPHHCCLHLYFIMIFGGSLFN